MPKKPLLVLGSKSPRRHEFLTYLGIPYSIFTQSIEEKSGFQVPKDFCEDLAKQKGLVVLKSINEKTNVLEAYDPTVLAADTIVAVDGKILGKPTDITHAKEMLKKLSGTVHQVITAVYLGKYADFSSPSSSSFTLKENIFSISTDVTFSELSDHMIDYYLEHEEVLDMAGSYGIQGMAQMFIQEIKGSYSNVVGLPLNEVRESLEDFFGKQVFLDPNFFTRENPFA